MPLKPNSLVQLMLAQIHKHPLIKVMMGQELTLARNTTKKGTNCNASEILLLFHHALIPFSPLKPLVSSLLTAPELAPSHQDLPLSLLSWHRHSSTGHGHTHRAHQPFPSCVHLHVHPAQHTLQHSRALLSRHNKAQALLCLSLQSFLPQPSHQQTFI